MSDVTVDSDDLDQSNIDSESISENYDRPMKRIKSNEMNRWLFMWNMFIIS